MLLDQEDVLELGLLKVCKTNRQNLKYLRMRGVQGSDRMKPLLPAEWCLSCASSPYISQVNAGSKTLWDSTVHEQS